METPHITACLHYERKRKFVMTQTRPTLPPDFRPPGTSFNPSPQ